MITYDVVQLSPEWFEAHLGVPSASKFDKLVTPAKMQPSTQLDDWAVELAAEKWSQQQANGWRGNVNTDYGLLAEDAGREYYQFVTGREVTTCGFVRHNSLEVIASPDGLLLSEGGSLEIKSTGAKQHVRCLQLNEPPREYICQTQGNLFVGAEDGIEWIDLLMFSETLPSKIFRITPNQRFQEILRAQIEKVLEERDRYVRIIEEAA